VCKHSLEGYNSLLDRRDREWCLRQASKSNFGVVTLTFHSWPRNWSFRDIVPCTICANLHQIRLILFQNIVFASLVTEERTNGRTDERTCRKRYASCQSTLTCELFANSVYLDYGMLCNWNGHGYYYFVDFPASGYCYYLREWVSV